MEKFQITDLPQSLGLWFSMCWQKQNIKVNHYKKLKERDCHFVNICIVQKNFKLLTPQNLGLWFSECQPKWNIGISHYEKIDSGSHFINIHYMEKFQIIDPPSPQVWVSGFQVSTETEYQHQPLWKIEKWLPSHKYASYGKNSNYWPSQSLGPHESPMCSFTLPDIFVWGSGYRQVWCLKAVRSELFFSTP